MRPGASASFCRQTCSVRFMLTCSSAGSGGRPRTSSGSLCSTGGLPAPVTPRPPRRQKCSSSRRASPSGVWYSSRKWPPQDSSRCSASRHSSSANSRKSATRPAFSSDWFSSSPSPGTLTFSRTPRAARGISLERPCAGRPRCGPCRSCPTSACPSSRWKRVDGALALDRRAAARSARATSASASRERRVRRRRPARAWPRPGSRRSCTGRTK